MLTKEKEELLFRHFFNQLRSILANNNNAANAKLAALGFKPMIATNGMEELLNEDIDDFIEKYRFGAGGTGLTEYGQEFLNSTDEVTESRGIKKGKLEDFEVIQLIFENRA